MRGLSLVLVLAVARVTLGADGYDSKGPGPKGGPVGYGEPKKGLDIHDLKKLLQTLEDDFSINLGLLSDATTLLAVGEARLNLINQRILPSIRQQNTQQDSIIDIAKDQVKSLEERADGIAALTAEAQTIADSTSVILQRQAESIDEFIVEVNKEQTINITRLREILDEWQQQVLAILDNEVDFITDRDEAESQRLSVLRGFVDGRYCEYGFALTTPGEGSIKFKTQFTQEPSVTLTTTGFRADTNKGYADKYDVLALDKAVGHVDKEGFSITAVDASEGKVLVDLFACQYMACQRLAEDVTLPTIDVTKENVNKP